MNLVAVGVNHTTADVELRERLAFSTQQAEAALASLRDMPGVREAALLSTCNRTEIYAACDGEGTAQRLRQFLAEVHDLDLTDIESAVDFGAALNQTWAGQNVTVQALDKGQPRSFDVTLDDKGSYYLQYYPDYYESWMSGKGFLGVAVTDQSVVTEGLAHPAQDGWSLLRYITLPFLKLQPFPEHFTALFEPSGLPGVLPDGLFWMTANLFYWIFWLNLMVGMTNALPAVPLDGGFIFGDSVAALLDRRVFPADARITWIRVHPRGHEGIGRDLTGAQDVGRNELAIHSHGQGVAHPRIVKRRLIALAADNPSGV